VNDSAPPKERGRPFSAGPGEDGSSLHSLGDVNFGAPIRSAPSTFAQRRRFLPWSKLYADQWRQIEASGISSGAKLLWVSLQSIMAQSSEVGV